MREMNKTDWKGNNMRFRRRVKRYLKRREKWIPQMKKNRNRYYNRISDDVRATL